MTTEQELLALLRERTPLQRKLRDLDERIAVLAPKADFERLIAAQVPSNSVALTAG